MSNYKKIEIRTDIAEMLKKLAKHRGLNLQELLEQFIEENVDDCELIELGYEEYIKH